MVILIMECLFNRILFMEINYKIIYIGFDDLSNILNF